MRNLKSLLARVYRVPASQIHDGTVLTELSTDPHDHITLTVNLDGLSDDDAAAIELHPERWTLAKLATATQGANP